jgi:hypothetical protein
MSARTGCGRVHTRTYAPARRELTIIDARGGFPALYCFEPQSERHKTLHGEALESFNELADARSSRLLSSRLKIPAPLRYLLYIGAVVLVASVWLFAVDVFAIHAAITAALAGAVSHVLYVIEDLDDCFSGNWQVSKDPFERAQRFMQSCIDEVCPA